MGSSYLLVALPILLIILQATNVRSDLLSPYLDNVCNEGKCGKGSCKASIIYLPLGYICECEAGWKRTHEDDHNDDFKFLPCVIPNCTLDYSCAPAPPPVPEKTIPFNSSFFDPCTWMYCAEGSCKKQSNLTHMCECKEGFRNILDVNIFPCYSDCVLGTDCGTLGITSSKSTGSSPNSSNGSSPNPSNNGKNQGSLTMPGSLNWLTISAMSLAVVLWK